MSLPFEFTLTKKWTPDGWVTLDPPIKKTATMIWVSPDYFAMCVWRLYGRTLAAKGAKP